LPSIFSDKITLSHDAGGCAFNDPVSLTDWPGATRVRIDDMPGWMSTADLDVIRTQRGVGDGDYIAKRFPFKSRMLLIEGFVMAASRAALESIWDLIQIQAFPANLDIKLTRYETVPKYVMARLAGPVEVTQFLPAEGGMRFRATLLCADPFKYDALNTISGGPTGVSGISSGGRTYPRVYPLVYNISASGSGNSITVYNAGTGIAYPTITITGPLPSGWRIENSTTGMQESFAIDLTTVSDTLVIDNKNKTALLNGAPINGLISGDWWGLSPKTNVIRLFGNYDPSADFSITAKSVWR
jgi:phage-related protein